MNGGVSYPEALTLNSVGAINPGALMALKHARLTQTQGGSNGTLVPSIAVLSFILFLGVPCMLEGHLAPRIDDPQRSQALKQCSLELV